MDLTVIKQKVQEVIRTYNPESLAPFPFESMVEQIEELRLQFVPTDVAISGVIFFQNGVFTMLINSDKPEPRQYFTVGHELGHYFLHRDWLVAHPSGFVDFSDTLDGQGMLLRPNDSSHSPDPIREKEANNFAAELLMPEDKVREYWRLSQSVEECAEVFRVSVAAMAIRLEKLGLS